MACVMWVCLALVTVFDGCGRKSRVGRSTVAFRKRMEGERERRCLRPKVRWCSSRVARRWREIDESRATGSRRHCEMMQVGVFSLEIFSW